MRVVDLTRCSISLAEAIELTINELASVEQKFHVFCRQEGIVHEASRDVATNTYRRT